jgi:predicted transcriptional regulator
MKVKVSEVMTCGVERISPTATLEHAAKQMKDHNVGLLPVMDGDNVVGVITDRDIVLRGVSERLRPEMTRVRDVMTAGAIFCYDDQDIAEASPVCLWLQHHRVTRCRPDLTCGKGRGVVGRFSCIMKQASSTSWSSKQ